MSSCLSGGGQTYRLDLDIVVKSSSSSSVRSSQTSSPSSTLSESSNSPRTISIKKARTPRKRPNQTYNEAAALLSTIYPNIFSTKSLRKLRKQQTRPFDPTPESAPPDLLLPPFPVLSDSAFLIRDPPPEKPAFHIEPKPGHLLEKTCASSPSNELREPSSPLPFDEDFDAESILDEEVEEGIDSILGNLTMNTTTTTTNGSNNDDSATCKSGINPHLPSLMGFGLAGGRFELGVGFSFARNMQRALMRSRDEGDWWRTPAVPVSDIVPKFKAPTPAPAPPEKKKKKKKVEKEQAEELQTDADNGSAGKNPKAALGLKLNHEAVLTAWSDRGSPFSDGPESPNSAADALARLADIDLSPEGGGGGVREASVLRYKEKRRNRLFAKKIRYQVRKVNADRRPRMKGRFVRSPSLLQQAMEEGNQ